MLACRLSLQRSDIPHSPLLRLSVQRRICPAATVALTLKFSTGSSAQQRHVARSFIDASALHWVRDQPCVPIRFPLVICGTPVLWKWISCISRSVSLIRRGSVTLAWFGKKAVLVALPRHDVAAHSRGFLTSLRSQSSAWATMVARSS